MAVERVREMVGDLNGKSIGLLGLSFKPNTDVLREAPSLELFSDLLAAGATATAYHPPAMPEAQRVLGNEPRIRYAQTPNEALERADSLVIVTEWKEFRSPDFDLIKAQLRQPLIVDGRNLYDPALMRGLGFDYLAIGR
jgi:UDPglucose 6-dehydrogenase